MKTILAVVLSIVLVPAAFAGGNCLNKHNPPEYCKPPPNVTHKHHHHNDKLKWLAVGIIGGLVIGYHWGGSKDENGWKATYEMPKVEGGL